MKKKIEHQNVYFISDFHIGHHNVIKFDGRPFRDVDEMHAELIKRWNSVIDDDDEVYYMGDLCMRDVDTAKWVMHALKGKIHFIMGNHDRDKIIKRIDRFETIHEYGTEILVKDDTITDKRAKGHQQIIMSHYPILSWNRSHYGSWMIHGHCHGSLMKSNQDYYKRKVMDVGCNVIDYTPISYQEVKSAMDKKVISNVDHHKTEE
jgi:calcineurin-like phosphoesterase family protein